LGALGSENGQPEKSSPMLIVQFGCCFLTFDCGTKNVL